MYEVWAFLLMTTESGTGGYNLVCRQIQHRCRQYRESREEYDKGNDMEASTLLCCEVHQAWVNNEWMVAITGEEQGQAYRCPISAMPTFRRRSGQK